MFDEVERPEARQCGDDTDEDGDRPDGDGSDGTGTTFREALAAVEVPAITVELSNSRTIDREAVEAGVSGLYEPRPGLSVGDRVATGDRAGIIYTGRRNH